jgi:energy-coupling factor transport system substrate-specific component
MPVLNRERTTAAANIVFWSIWGGLTGVLWAYVNPISLVPGIIHFRTFAFIPAITGILFGPRSGFLSGYIGTIVWSLLAGTFIPAHSLLAGGIMAGFTGFLPAVMVGRGRTFQEMAADKTIIWTSASWSLIAGVVMLLTVSASLSILKIFDFGWALIWIGISNIAPMVIGTPLLVKFLAGCLAKFSVRRVGVELGHGTRDVGRRS